MQLVPKPLNVFRMELTNRILRWSNIRKYFLDVPICPEKGHLSHVIEPEEVLGFFPKGV